MKLQVWVLMLSGVVGTLAHAQEKVNQGAMVLTDFDHRVAEYGKLHKRVEAELHGLKPTSSPERIEQYEHKLAHDIREARRGASQGEIFTLEIAAEFRRLIGETMRSAEGARIRESLRSGAPVAVQALHVNGSYPHGVPLPTTPPSLLANLPVLPPDLEYRVVGRTLLLRDVDANLIIDFIPNAIS